MNPDWSTPEGLTEIRNALAAAIPGWRQPVAHAVGLSSASSSRPRGTMLERTML